MRWQAVKALKRNFISYLTLTLLAVVIGYPLVWLFFSSFKESAEIFATINLLPKQWIISGYIDGWVSTSQSPFSLFLINSLKLVIPQ